MPATASRSTLIVLLSPVFGNQIKQLNALQTFSRYDQQGRSVYALSDLRKIFHEDDEPALRSGIKRLIKNKILIRACQGVFVYAQAQSKVSDRLEQIACTIRRGAYNYVSLESALSDYGVISQIPVDRLTVMTTGRSGEFKTPFGTVEFIHSKRDVVDMLESSVEVGRPLRLAKKHAAIRDLKQVGRNVHLLEESALNES